jgi:hypothetical protein
LADVRAERIGSESKVPVVSTISSAIPSGTEIIKYFEALRLTELVKPTLLVENGEVEAGYRYCFFRRRS